MNLNDSHRLNRLYNLTMEARRIQEQTRRAVADALTAGASWTEIGTALGVSKQTAHARYGKDRPEPAPAPAAEPSKLSDADVAGTSETPSIFSDAKEPALNDWSGAIDHLGRQVYWLEGPADATAQPGTGVGDHNCPRCQASNHKGGAWHTVAAFPECEPTRFDPQNIVDWFYRSMKITKTKATTK